MRCCRTCTGDDAPSGPAAIWFIRVKPTNLLIFWLLAGFVPNKLLADGTRQIVDFQIPGDFLGLRSLLFHTADHNIEPLTPIEVSEVDASDLLAAFSASPRLATAVLWAASRDEAMVVEHLVSIGRRNAFDRTAHFLLELGTRLKLVGLATRAGYDCPLSQYLLGDALGLSAVHVNRVLRQLRESGYLTFQRGHVTFDDFDGLVALVGFDKDYLDHDGPLLCQAMVACPSQCRVDDFQRFGPGCSAKTLQPAHGQVQQI